MKSFACDKNLGPGGWPIELFLHFEDIMGTNILAISEESWNIGYIPGDINSTFITLIPKVLHASNFVFYRPISLWNTLYKSISKIIANRLKPTLSDGIS